MTDVLDVGHDALDDFTSTQESKPKAATPPPASSDCHYCSETFEGPARFFRRGAHEKDKHHDQWIAAKAGVKPKKSTAKKAAPKPRPATGPVTGPKSKRIPASETISLALGMAGQAVAKVDGPMGRALVFSAPATGEAVDELVAGTVVDRMVIQKFAGAADKWEKVGGIIAFPVLIAVISRNPALFQPLEGQLRAATVDVINASIPTLKKKAASEKKAAESLSELGKIDPRYAESDDPIKLILEDIFGAYIVSPNADADGETQ